MTGGDKPLLRPYQYQAHHMSGILLCAPIVNQMEGWKQRQYMSCRLVADFARSDGMPSYSSYWIGNTRSHEHGRNLELLVMKMSHPITAVWSLVVRSDRIVWSIYLWKSFLWKRRWLRSGSGRAYSNLLGAPIGLLTSQFQNKTECTASSSRMWAKIDQCWKTPVQHPSLKSFANLLASCQILQWLTFTLGMTKTCCTKMASIRWHDILCRASSSLPDWYWELSIWYQYLSVYARIC